MNSSVYRLRLDIHSPTSQELINMNKGETARRIEIEFCENNTAYKLEDSVAAVICISDDTTLYPVKIDGNKVVYEPLAELTGTVGIKDVQVRLMQSMNDTVNHENAETDRLLYSPRFSVAVHDVVNDGSTVEEQAKQGDVIAQINEVIRKAENGEFNGQDGKDGIDGYSPEVTITPSEQPSGHYVKITDAEHPQGQEFFVADGQGGGSGLSFSVFVIEWKTNPTTEDKTTIVSQFDAMAQIGGHRYIARLKVGSDVLDGVIYGSNKATFFDFGSGTAVPKVYTISASSVEAYNQTSEYFYNTILFDENSDIPASQAVITDYINGKLSTALGSVETELETITTGGGVA